MLGGDGNRAIGAAKNGAWVVEGIGVPEVDDEPSVLGTGHESHACAHLDTKCFVGLGVRNARRRRSVGTPAPPDVDGAGSGGGTTRVRHGTNTSGIRSRADVALDFLRSVPASKDTA